MSEQYIGVRFRTVFLEKRAPEFRECKEIVKWAEKFDGSGLAPTYSRGSCDNFSFRVESGFVITPTATFFSKMKAEDLVMVVECNRRRKEVYVKGLKTPSSESFLHYEIYGKRADINAIFHFHDDRLLKNADKLGIKVTENWQPYGSLALVDEVMKILGKHDAVLMKKHGAIVLGKTILEAGKTGMELHKKALKFSGPAP